jgi:CIC family chloride channel protein
LSRQLRHRLADDKAVLTLCVLGALTGISTGGVIIAFRHAIEIPLTYFLPGNDPEFFEALPTWLHFIQPVVGALLLGLIYYLVQKHTQYQDATQTGIPYVIHRLNQHHGILPARNALMQFIGGAIALISGQSAGREGPAIHLGGSAGSLIGQYWKIPNNSTRVLVGCGVAAAIAASFNTPIAGVIFAMEVVMMEYSIAGFTPIIMAAVSGTIVTRLTYGTAPAFNVPATELKSLWELPVLAILGATCGSLAAAFIVVSKRAQKFRDKPVMLRFLAAGIITGGLALLCPQILGIGYDSLNLALIGGLSLSTLALIVGCKLVATASSSGLGLPIGVIGPNLLIGACVGGLFSVASHDIIPAYASSDSLYVMMGMGAMMGAILNAPLAALMALLELTNNAHIILPAMLTIIAATLTTSEIFKQKAVHQTILESNGTDITLTPMMQTLAHTGVTRVMNQNVSFVKEELDTSAIAELIERAARWIVVLDSSKNHQLISGPALEALITAEPDLLKSDSGSIKNIDLLALALEYRAIRSVGFQANLSEAWQTMKIHNCDAVFIHGSPGPFTPLFTGVLTKNDIENFYTSN